MRWRPAECGRGVAAYAAVGAERIDRRAVAPICDRLLRGPGLRGAETKLCRNGLDDLAERLLAALDIEERAGRRFGERQLVKRRDVGDMDIRPAVQSAPDVTGDAGRLGLAGERRHLHALR